MRGLRSFVGLLTVLVALGAYLYFVESKRTPGDDADKKEKVFAVEADKIEEVTIRSEAGDRTTLKKSGTEWQVVAPAPAAADAAEISGITSNLSTLEQQRVIEENPANLADFGLAEPRVEVTFKSGGQEQKLLIGGKTPTGADLYAKTAAQPKVFLIASYLDSTFNRATFDLRDKSALKFERDSADSLEIVTADRTLKFAKTNGEWQIAQPVTTRPDASAIEGLIGRLGGLQMKTLAAAEPGDLAQYGLATPAATVKIGTGSSLATLLIGSAAEEGSVYAKDGSRPAVFTVEAALAEDLKRDPGAYRQKDLFDARSFNTTRVEVARAGVTAVFEKAMVKDKDGNEQLKWRQTAPAAREIDGAKVDALLSSLTGARADSFVDAPPGGAKPEAVFALKFDEGRKEERVTFLKAGSDAYAVREGTAGAAKVDSGVLDEILKGLDALK
ncbi:MAG TPA: DUF4340 domain-containing protein [Vicinamibacterales bacterium]|nr:DUF4340 domain-containing protein [Vicinamibacterales bacterium]